MDFVTALFVYLFQEFMATIETIAQTALNDTVSVMQTEINVISQSFGQYGVMIPAAVAVSFGLTGIVVYGMMVLLRGVQDVVA